MRALSLALAGALAITTVGIAGAPAEALPSYDLLGEGSALCNPLKPGRFNKDKDAVELARVAVEVCLDKERAARSLLVERTVEPQLMQYCADKNRYLHSYVHLTKCIDREERAHAGLREGDIEPEIIAYCSERYADQGYVTILSCTRRETLGKQYLERNAADIDQRLLSACDKKARDHAGRSYSKLQICVVAND